MTQKKVITVSIICTLLLYSTNCLAQHKNEISVYAGFLQLQDELNQSMVYNGTQLGFHYQRYWLFENWEMRYKPKIALGVPFNRSMIAANIRFVPVDFSAMKQISQTGFRVGLNFAADYSYQAYPHQHAAYLFWHGSIGIAPCFEYTYQWNERKIKVFLQNSLAGFVSRTESVSHYFYSFKLSDFFTQPHQNMQFGSFDKYVHFNASIEYAPNVSKNYSFAFGVEYIDNYFSNRFQTLNYYLQWKKSF
jgi:hypothetical protein